MNSSKAKKWYPEGYKRIKAAFLQSRIDGSLYSESMKEYQRLRHEYPAAHLFLHAKRDLSRQVNLQKCLKILEESNGADIINANIAFHAFNLDE